MGKIGGLRAEMCKKWVINTNTIVEQKLSGRESVIVACGGWKIEKESTVPCTSAELSRSVKTTTISEIRCPFFSGEQVNQAAVI